MKTTRTSTTKKVIATLGIAATALFATAAVATVSSSASPTTSGVGVIAGIIPCFETNSCTTNQETGTHEYCYTTYVAWTEEEKKAANVPHGIYPHHEKRVCQQRTAYPGDYFDTNFNVW